MVVIEDAANRRAIIQHHVARRILVPRTRVRRREHRHGRLRIGGRRAFRHSLRASRRRFALALENGLFDFPQPAHLLPHLNLGVTVGIQDGLSHVPQEMVVTIAMGHVRELRRDSRDEGILPVRDPKRDRLTQVVRPLLGLDDQPSDLIGRRGDQGLGEPHALLRHRALQNQPLMGASKPATVLGVIGLHFRLEPARVSDHATSPAAGFF